jgi:hypothetical protein
MLWNREAIRSQAKRIVSIPELMLSHREVIASG